MIPDISIIGNGNTAYTLGGIFFNAQIPIKKIYARSSSALELANNLKSELIILNSNTVFNDEFIFLMVSDDAIKQLIDQYTFHNCTLIHCSGSVPLATLISDKSAVFYPLQSMSKNHLLSAQQIPICLESNHEPTLQILNHIAAKAGFDTDYLDSDMRLKVHIAAVMLNNFSNQLWLQVDKLCDENKINKDLLKPLLNQTVEKYTTLGAYQAQTGPARRNDQDTIDKHLSLLNGDSFELYKLFSKLIINEFKK